MLDTLNFDPARAVMSSDFIEHYLADVSGTAVAPSFQEGGLRLTTARPVEAPMSLPQGFQTDLERFRG